MSNFKNNFSNIGLLSKKEVKFWNEKEDFFYLKLPTVYDIYTNADLSYFISFLDTDIEELKKGFVGIDIESHYELIKILMVLSRRREDLEDLCESFTNSFKLLLPEFFLDNFLNIKKGTILDKKLFDEIVIILYASLDKKRVIVKKDDDEFTKIEKAAALRAQRIRDNSKNKEGSNPNYILDMMAAVIYEFPQYKLEDVFELNLYTLNYLFKYIGKIANYEVSKIAAGNGLSKKHKYFIEK